MRSARRAVLSRCAMMIMVRPGRSSSIWRHTRASVARSSELVGSSRMTMGASRSRARASASRWRWPPESVQPSSPSTVAYPCGRSRMNGSASARRAAARISSNGTAAPNAMFSATVVWNRIGSCSMKRELAAQRADRHLAHVVAVDGDAPALGIEEPRDQAGQRGLARSGVSHQRHALARPDVQVQPAQDRAVRLVAEGHAFEAHVGRPPAAAAARRARPGCRAACRAPRRRARGPRREDEISARLWLMLWIGP